MGSSPTRLFSFSQIISIDFPNTASSEVDYVIIKYKQKGGYNIKATLRYNYSYNNQWGAHLLYKLVLVIFHNFQDQTLPRTKVIKYKFGI